MVPEVHESADSAVVMDQSPDASLATGLDLKEDKKATLVVQRTMSSEMSRSDGLALLAQTIEDHQYDQNFPREILHRAAQLIREEKDGLVTDDHVKELLQEIEKERDLLLNDSPYPEVRAVVDNTDDPAIPCNTIRVWVLGLLLATLGSGINALFTFRQPGISVTVFVAQVVSYPLGRACARFLPTRQVNLSRWSFTLNPGPFSQKEHILITVMAAVSFGGAYVTDLFVVLNLPRFFNRPQIGRNMTFQLLLAISTQLLGYGTAGLTRRLLVYPQQMIWPGSIAHIALNKALHHDDGRIQGALPGPFFKLWNMSRNRFMLYTGLAMMIYFWFPGYLFQALSYFSWMTWIAPRSVLLALISGSQTGLGFGNPWTTFDWNLATTLIDPIISPLFSTLNIAAGMLFLLPIIVLVFFTNTWHTGYLPIASNHVFDNTATRYNVSRILNSAGVFDQAKYDAYSPAYFSASMALTYAAYFALYTATVTHTILYHRKPIWEGIKSVWRRENARDGNRDVHNRLMDSYKEAPEWWYLTIAIISTVLGCVVVKVFDTGMPIWGVFFAIAMCLVLQIPIGIISAVSNVEVTLNVLAEFIGGLVTPGNPLAMMIFKTYGYIATSQSLSFSADLKTGHYMKIPPRVMFSAQTVATIVGAIVSVLVTDWTVDNIPNMCDRHQSDHFTCPGTNTFFSAAVLWGALGPKRMYGSGGMYHVLTLGFLVGLLLPIPVYLITRWKPNSWLRYVHIPVFLVGFQIYSQYNLSYMTPGVIMALYFNYYIKHKYTAWWEKYAYVLTTSWTVAIAFTGLIIFFAVQYHEIEVSWWGNNVISAGCDAEECPWLQVPESGHF